MLPLSFVSVRLVHNKQTNKPLRHVFSRVAVYFARCLPCFWFCLIVLTMNQHNEKEKPGYNGVVKHTHKQQEDVDSHCLMMRAADEHEGGTDADNDVDMGIDDGELSISMDIVGESLLGTMHTTDVGNSLSHTPVSSDVYCMMRYFDSSMFQPSTLQFMQLNAGHVTAQFITHLIRMDECTTATDMIVSIAQQNNHPAVQHFPCLPWDVLIQKVGFAWMIPPLLQQSNLPFVPHLIGKTHPVHGTVLMAACLQKAHALAIHLMTTYPEQCHAWFVLPSTHANALLYACQKDMIQVVDALSRMPAPSSTTLSSRSSGSSSPTRSSCATTPSTAPTPTPTTAPTPTPTPTPTPATTTSATERIGKYQQTPLQYLCSRGYPDIAMRILRTLGPNACALHQTDIRHRNVLFTTILCKQRDASLTILAHGAAACGLADADFDGSTPLMYACMFKRREVALAIVNHGAEACGLSQRDAKGRTALMIACTFKLTRVALHMLDTHGAEACGLSGVDHNQDTALMIACRNKLKKVAISMMSFGAEACNIRHIKMIKPFGMSALTQACESKQTGIALRMLHHFSSEELRVMDVQCAGHAMFWACFNRMHAVASKLLTFDRAVCEIFTDSVTGRSTLIYACMSGMWKCTAQMLKYANACEPLHQDTWNKTAYDYLLQSPVPAGAFKKRMYMLAKQRFEELNAHASVAMSS